MMIPNAFWLTTGVGESDISELVALDLALMEAGIGYQNHICVSSVPPVNEIFPKIDKVKGITSVKYQKKEIVIPSSTLLYVVRAMKSGKKGENIAGVIDLVKILTSEKNTSSCLLAYESTGEELNQVKESARNGLLALVERREAKIDSGWGEKGFKTVTSSLHITKKFGCASAFVVFDPFSFKSISSPNV